MTAAMFFKLKASQIRPKSLAMAFIFLFSVLILCDSNSASAGEEIKLSLGVSPLNNIFIKIKEPFEKETGIKLEYVFKDPKGLGADQVMKDVDSKLAEAGAGGIGFEDWKELMKEKNYIIKNVADMKFKVIGRDRIQFFTHIDGPKALTIHQLRDILIGKVKNFKEVGGPDQAITLVYSPKQPATEKFIKKNFLGGKDLEHGGNSVLLPETSVTADLVKKVATTPGGFAFGPIDLIDATVQVPKHEVSTN
jgi:PBP superfamily domain